MTKDLTRGNPVRVILKFALPVIGGNLFQLFYTLADTMIVGQTLGEKALSSVGATGVAIYFILCFIQGFTGGCGILLGQAFGAKNEQRVKRGAVASVVLSALFTLIVTPAACLMTAPAAKFLNIPDEIFADAASYLFIIFAGTGATVFYNLISNILRALGDSRTPLIFLIFSSLLNIGLDYLFILPLGMGVGGAALATILSQLIAAVLCTVVSLRRFEILRVSRSDMHADFSTIRAYLKTGVPMGFQMSVMCIGLLAMQSSINSLGTDAIAGYTAASKVDQMSGLVNTALGLAVSSFVAQNFGAGLFDRIRSGVLKFWGLTVLADLAMAGILLVLRPYVVPMFITDTTPEVMRYASEFFTVTLPFYPLLGTLILFRSAVQSMGNTAAPFAACIAELIARVACAVGLSIPFGFVGICFATPLAWLAATAIVTPVYFILIKRLGYMRR